MLSAADMDYMTLKEADGKWGISSPQVNYYCVEGRIHGAVKMAGVWLVPKGAENRRIDDIRKVGKTMLHIAICDDERGFVQHLAEGDLPEAVRYCEDLRTPVREISGAVWTGDKALDYLISSKMALAEQEQIKTRVNIEYPRNTNIRSVDLTTILGNLLDNALEASKTAPAHLRFLNLTIRRINAMLIIKVENGYGDAPIENGGKLETSKADKSSHGWGLKSVQTAADRYDGTITTSYKDGVFQSVVTLSFQPVQI